MTTTPTIIEKENVVDLQFPGIPIEKSKADMNKLFKIAKIIFSNIHRTKMRILLEDSGGKRSQNNDMGCR